MKQGISSPAGRRSKVAFDSEFTTLWSFAKRGSWATHNPNYRGNFAPQVARNVIEMYSQPGQVVLDPMCGGGTTLIECKLLGRNGIGCDINPEAVELTKSALNFQHVPLLTNSPPAKGEYPTGGRGFKAAKTNPSGLTATSPSQGRSLKNPKLEASATIKSRQDAGGTIRVADTRNLGFIGDEAIDLILTHPPYLNIIRYSDGIAGDLSAISSVNKFCGEMEVVARELFRVLKPDRYCAILMGDTRRGRHFVPLAYRVMERFLKAGFVLKEDIIKAQHNCSATGRWKWKALKDKFYLIMHEHLFVFRKPAAAENLSRVKESMG